MASIKPRDIPSFLRSPPSRFRLILLYGPDRGLTAERADRISMHIAGSDADSVLRLDGDLLVQQPGRLADEVQSQNLFTPVKLVRVRDGDRPITAAIKAVLNTLEDAPRILIEAGDLKPANGLRKLVEGTGQGAALPAYRDDGAAIANLLDARLQDEGLVIDRDAREEMIALLGSDHGVSRSEIDKLALFAHGRDRITRDDVRAICGDTAASQTNALVDAVAGGDHARTLASLERLCADGQAPSALLTALARHFVALNQAVAGLRDGKSIETAVSDAFFRLHFSRKSAINKQVREWSMGAIHAVNKMLSETTLEMRRHSGIESTLLERSALQIAEMARRQTTPNRPRP